MSARLEAPRSVVPLVVGLILVGLLTLLTSRWGLGYGPVLGGSLPWPRAGFAP